MAQRVADFEMKRRQQAVLQVMKKDDVDCIVMYKFGDRFGATLRYLTDQVGGYPPTAIMSADGVAIFKMGPFSDTEYPVCTSVGDRLPEGVWQYQGLPNNQFLMNAVPQSMVKYIKKHNFKKVGWTGLQFIPASMYIYLTANLPGVEFVDFTDQVDAVRRVKSPYEIERWMKTVELHDRLIACMPAMIRPGINPLDLGLEIDALSAKLGAIEFQNRVINFARGDKYFNLASGERFQTGDYIYVLIEVAGPGGEWGEVGRVFSLGVEPNEKWKANARNICAVQDAIAAASKPGGIPQEIFRMSNRMLKEFGYPEETRIHTHGQTYDIVDLPAFVEGDVIPLQENEFFVIHPGFAAPPYIMNHTDNYLVEKNGSRRLNKTPREIIPVPVY